MTGIVDDTLERIETAYPAQNRLSQDIIPSTRMNHEKTIYNEKIILR